MKDTKYLDEDLFCRKKVSKTEELLAKRRAPIHFISSIKRSLFIKGARISLRELCKIAEIDINFISSAVQKLLEKKVPQICQASSDFQKGCVVVQLYAEHDDCIRWAINNGSIVAVTDHQIDNLPCIIVEDPMWVYSVWCGYYYGLRNIPSIVVTGSIGKTTVTQMINSVLSSQFKTFGSPTGGNHLASAGFWSQHIPLNIERYIQEIGENPPMHTLYMSKILTPSVAVLTTIDSSHIEIFGTQENIVKSVCAVSSYMKTDRDPVVVNKDEFSEYELLGKHRVVSISTKTTDADYYSMDVQLTNEGISFVIMDSVTKEKYPVILHNIFAHHNVISALLAFAAGVCAGVDKKNIVKGLCSYRTRGIRQNIVRADNNVLIYADCYNAAPKSMKSAIDTVCNIPVNGKRIAVLGDIAEVGDMSDEIHRQIINYAINSEMNCIIVKGKNMIKALESIGIKDGHDIIKCISNEDCCKAIKSVLGPNDIVLFKSSHSGHLEDCIRVIWPKTFKKIIKEDKKPYIKWKIRMLLS